MRPPHLKTQWWSYCRGARMTQWVAVRYRSRSWNNNCKKEFSVPNHLEPTLSTSGSRGYNITPTIANVW